MTTHDATHDNAAHGSEPIDLRKLGMWIFLSSECIFFGTLIITFLVSRARSAQLPGPDGEVLNISITTIITFILLLSSLTMVLSLEGFQHDNIRQGQMWLVATIVLGTIFVGTQVYEYTQLVHEGLTLTSNLFGSAFYTLTGFHGTHVFIGVLLLLSLLLMSRSGKLNARNFLPVELIGLYWHFVDLVWLVIFTLVYLLK